MNDVRAMLQSGISVSSSASEVVPEDATPDIPAQVVENAVYVYGGLMHRVPEGFEWPKKNINVKLLFDFWYFGRRNCSINGVVYNIVPLKLLDANDYGKGNKRAFTAAKRVMKELGGNPREIATITDFAERERCFEGLFTELMTRLEVVGKDAEWRRQGELSYLTVYDDILKYEKMLKIASNVI